MESLANDGAVGLILAAKTLTNDQLKSWRHKFFSGVNVHRITNFSNLVNLLFSTAKLPAVTLVYTKKAADNPAHSILHFGPFVANQCVLPLPKTNRRRLWVI